MPALAVDPDTSVPLRPWDGTHVIVPVSTAQLTSFLADSILHQQTSDTGDDLFSLSPLTTPESTPTSTPAATPPPSPKLPCLNLHMEDPQASASPISLPPEAPLPENGLSKAPKQSGPKPKRNLNPKRMRKLQALGHATRKKSRKTRQAAQFGDAPLPSGASSRYVAAAQPIYTATDSVHANVTSTGFAALDQGSIGSKAYRIYALEDLVGENSEFKLSLQEWDGKTPMAIVDLDGRIIGILAGTPDADGWEEQHRAAAQHLEHTRQRCRLPKKSAHHRRGAFTTLRCGFSHGGGSTQPGNCASNKKNAGLLQELVLQEPFKRIAGFGSSLLKGWAPGLHKHYVEKLGDLQKQDPTLKRPFPNSVFPSTTFNLGPRTVCYPHRDFANLPFGYCAITALGSFDPKKGGHLVLWECSLVIEFPPGSTVLIPSSIITHFNTAVGKSETRYSCTQYAAGGLFRWVEHGFKKVETFRQLLSAEELAELDRKNDERWMLGLSLLPRLPSASSS